MDEQNQPPEPVQEPTPTPEEPPTPVTEPPARVNTDAYITWGFILAALGFVCCCCGQLFAVASIILGAIAYGKGDQRGMWVMIAGAVSLLISGGAGVSYLFVPHMWPHQFRPHDWMNGPWRVT